MAPEQARGDEVDGRADQFGLGAVLYELASGRAPFTRPNAAQTLDAILNREPEPLVLRVPDPRAAQLDATLRRMLAKDRNARYATLAEAVVELRAIRRGDPAQSAPAPPAGRAVAVLDFTNITGNGEDDWIGTGIAETVTTDVKDVPGLTVISRARVREALRALGAAPGSDPSALAARVAREVGARFLLSGGFQRAGESVRVTGQILETATGAVLRTVKLDGSVSAIFELQDRIVCELAEGLRLGLQPGERLSDETRVI
jgi:TolB-like protein